MHTFWLRTLVPGKMASTDVKAGLHRLEAGAWHSCNTNGTTLYLRDCPIGWKGSVNSETGTTIRPVQKRHQKCEGVLILEVHQL